MSIKFLLKIFPFILLNYNISNCIHASNTSNSLNNKKQDKTDNTKKSTDHNNINPSDNKKHTNTNNTKKKKKKKQNDDNDKEKNNEEDEDNDINEHTDSNNENDETEEDDNNNQDTENNDDESDEADEKEDDEGNEDDEESNDTEEDDEDEEEENDEDNENDEEIDDTEEDDEEEDVYADKDPLEKFNRAIFAFNDKMNNVLNKITSSNKSKDDKSKKSEQSKVTKAIGNFSHNFFEAPRIVNYALQGNIKNMSNSIARLIINTAFGFFGVTDIAEKLGFKKNDTYFGDTLKKWGMKPGPYVVLPILGPTSLRGTVGKVFETLPMQLTKLPLHNLKPFTRNAIYYATYCCNLLAARSAYGDMIETVSSMSKDKYKTFRNIIMSMENN